MKRVQDYFRSFPDLLPRGSHIHGYYTSGKGFFFQYTGKFFLLYFGILLFILSLLLLSMYFAYASRLGANSGAVMQLDYWEDVIRAYPNYPDAYYNAAYYAAQSGDGRLGLRYVDSALYLDGNFEEAKELREEILREL